MKTLVQIDNDGEYLEFIYLVDWPEIVEKDRAKKIIYPDIRLINAESLFLQKETFDGWIGLEVEKSKVRITPELEKKFLKKQLWKQIRTTNRTEFLLPPINLINNVEVIEGREITLAENFARCGKETCKIDVHGPYIFAHIKNPLNVLSNIYIGCFASFPMLIYKDGKWGKFIRRKNEFRNNK